MSIPDRFARIARHKFNEIKDRIDQWDSEAEERADAKTRRESDAKSEANRAQRELDDSMDEPRAFPKETGSASRPAPRTPAEIARGVSNPNYAPQTPASSGLGPLGKTLSGSGGNGGGGGGNSGAGTQDGDASLDYHYRLLGVEPGSDFTTVQSAYNKFAARCDVSRFPAGSKEAQEAEKIRKKLDVSFDILRAALDVTARRFGLLDFDDAPASSAAPPTSSLEL